MNKENSSTATLKTQARALRTYLAEQGVELGHSRCLEAVARSHGYKNWDTASGGTPELRHVAEAGAPTIKRGERIADLEETLRDAEQHGKILVRAWLSWAAGETTPDDDMNRDEHEAVVWFDAAPHGESGEGATRETLTEIIDSPDWDGSCPKCGSPSVWYYEGPRRAVFGVRDGEVFVDVHAETRPFLRCSDCHIQWPIPDKLEVCVAGADEWVACGGRSRRHPNPEGESDG